MRWGHVTVYEPAGVLIKVSHLLHIATLSLHTCVPSYVRCGFSARPAVRSHESCLSPPGGFLLSIKNILSVPLCHYSPFCLSCLCSWKRRDLKKKRDVFGGCGSRLLVSILPVWAQIRRFVFGRKCSAGLHTPTHAPTSAPGSKNTQRERCMSEILLHNSPHCTAFWHGKLYTAAQLC